jgi:SET domain-containing protein
MSYKPLPDNLTIKESPIHGLGVFATEDIKEYKYIESEGEHFPYKNWIHPSHMLIKNEHFPDYKYLMRLEIGGFINHSSTPNVTLEEYTNDITKQNNNIKLYGVQPLRDIKAGEELLLDYNKELCGLSGYKDEEWLK